MEEIVVIGSSNTDLVIKTQRIPEPGETVLGGVFMMTAGGKGANQAVAAARLGGSTSFVARVGRDMFGERALENYAKDNLNTDFVFVDEQAYALERVGGAFGQEVAPCGLEFLDREHREVPARRVGTVFVKAVRS